MWAYSLTQWSHGDLNPEPPACKAGALPIAPWPRLSSVENRLYPYPGVSSTEVNLGGSWARSEYGHRDRTPSGNSLVSTV